MAEPKTAEEIKYCQEEAVSEGTLFGVATPVFTAAPAFGASLFRKDLKRELGEPKAALVRAQQNLKALKLKAAQPSEILAAEKNVIARQESLASIEADVRTKMYRTGYRIFSGITAITLLGGSALTLKQIYNYESLPAAVVDSHNFTVKQAPPANTGSGEATMPAAKSAPAQ